MPGQGKALFGDAVAMHRGAMQGKGGAWQRVARLRNAKNGNAMAQRSGAPNSNRTAMAKQSDEVRSFADRCQGAAWLGRAMDQRGLELIGSVQ